MMTNHDKAIIVESLISTFMNIKKLSSCGRIDQLCTAGVSKLVDLTNAEQIQAELDEVRRRRIDPTA